jgi:hypothetical protein
MCSLKDSTLNSTYRPLNRATTLRTDSEGYSHSYILLTHQSLSEQYGWTAYTAYLHTTGEQFDFATRHGGCEAIVEGFGSGSGSRWPVSSSIAADFISVRGMIHDA